MTKRSKYGIILKIFKRMRDIGKLTRMRHILIILHLNLFEGLFGQIFFEDLMKFKAKLMDENAIRRALVRISHEITERNNGVSNLVLVGIKSRGVPLAAIIADNIMSSEGERPETRELDIRHYRDDLRAIAADPVVDESVKFSVQGKKIVLVDDVLYTGRTARAALEALIKQGRPALVQLAVLVDRGHRELPIRADYVGKNLPTSRSEEVKVNIPPYDSEMSVELYEK